MLLFLQNVVDTKYLNNIWGKIFVEFKSYFLSLDVSKKFCKVNWNIIVCNYSLFLTL